MEACFVCLGSKVSPFTGGTCKCCNGVGEIPENVASAKKAIRADIEKRLTLPGDSAASLVCGCGISSEKCKSVLDCFYTHCP